MVTKNQSGKILFNLDVPDELMGSLPSKETSTGLSKIVNIKDDLETILERIEKEEERLKALVKKVKKYGEKKTPSRWYQKIFRRIEDISPQSIEQAYDEIIGAIRQNVNELIEGISQILSLYKTEKKNIEELLNFLSSNPSYDEIMKKLEEATGISLPPAILHALKNYDTLIGSNPNKVLKNLVVLRSEFVKRMEEMAIAYLASLKQSYQNLAISTSLRDPLVLLATGRYNTTISAELERELTSCLFQLNKLYREYCLEVIQQTIESEQKFNEACEKLITNPSISIKELLPQMIESKKGTPN